MPATMHQHLLRKVRDGYKPFCHSNSGSHHVLHQMREMLYRYSQTKRYCKAAQYQQESLHRFCKNYRMLSDLSVVCQENLFYNREAKAVSNKINLVCFIYA